LRNDLKLNDTKGYESFDVSFCPNPKGKHVASCAEPRWPVTVSFMNDNDLMLAQQGEILLVIIEMLRADFSPDESEITRAIHDPRLERIAQSRLQVVGNLQTAIKQALYAVILLERERRRRSGD
jgi:hypothetical protein